MRSITKEIFIIFLLLTTNISDLYSQTFDHNYTALQKVYDSSIWDDGKQTLVDYKNIKLNPTNLNNQLKQMEELSEINYNKFSANNKKAFLINTYNAFTIKLIIDNYPTKSIKKLGTLLKSPWENKFIQLFGEKHHLNYIEHERLRKDFPDERIHFAVVCASIGCPSLPKKVFTGDNLDKQLDAASKHFINNQSKNNYNKDKNILYISKIFNWYEDDFTKENSSVKKFISSRMESMKDLPVEKLKATTIKYLDYSWDLNETKPKLSSSCVLGE